MTAEQGQTQLEGSIPRKEQCCFGNTRGERKSSQSKRLEATVWSALLLWGGAVLLAANTGALDRWLTRAAYVPRQADGWTVFFLGAALILVVEIALRTLVPAYGKPELCTCAGALVVSALAPGSWALFWPLVLLVAGASLLLSAVRQQDPNAALVG